MRLPKPILDKIKKTEILSRRYPLNLSIKEQTSALLEAGVIEGKCIGFIVSRHPMKPTGNPKEYILEPAFHDTYYEPKEILRALADYQSDVTPLTNAPVKDQTKKPWQQAPRLTLETRKLPQEQSLDKKEGENKKKKAEQQKEREDILLRIQKGGKPPDITPTQ